MNRNRIQVAAICAFAFVLVFAAVAGAQATKVAGKWDMTTEGGQRGPQTSTLTLMQDGGKLTGTMAGGRGDTPVTEHHSMAIKSPSLLHERLRTAT